MNALNGALALAVEPPTCILFSRSIISRADDFYTPPHPKLKVSMPAHAKNNQAGMTQKVFRKRDGDFYTHHTRSGEFSGTPSAPSLPPEVACPLFLLLLLLFLLRLLLLILLLLLLLLLLFLLFLLLLLLVSLRTLHPNATETALPRSLQPPSGCGCPPNPPARQRSPAGVGRWP